MAVAHRPDDVRFLFRGSAVALGGRLWDPVRKKDDPLLPRQGAEFLPSQASVWLPITGGTETSRAESGFSFEHIDHYAVRARYAESSVEGGYIAGPGDRVRVVVSTMIRDLHVRSGPRCDPEAHFVDVEKIWVVIESRHTLHRNEETRIRVTRFEIENMKIDGVPFDVECGSGKNEIKDHETARGLKNKMKSDPEFKQKHMRFLDNPDHVSDIVLIDRDPVVCTIIDDIVIADPGVEAASCAGNVIDIDGFGKIHIGELVISPSDRRLSAMRFELGSPTEASFTAGSGATDGSTWPP